MKSPTPLPKVLAAAQLLLRGAIGSLVALAFLVADLPCMVEWVAESLAESVKSTEVAAQGEARLRVKAPRQLRERSIAVPRPHHARRLPPDGLLAAIASTHPAPSGSPVPLRC